MTKDSNYRTKVKGYKNASSPVNSHISPESATWTKWQRGPRVHETRDRNQPAPDKNLESAAQQSTERGEAEVHY